MNIAFSVLSLRPLMGALKNRFSNHVVIRMRAIFYHYLLLMSYLLMFSPHPQEG